MRYAQPVDNSLDTPKSTLNLSTYLTAMLRFTSSFRAASAVRSGRTLKLWGALYALAASVTIGVQPAEAVTNSDHLKLYLHSRVIDYKQFQCAVDVAHHESRWRVEAKNGDHYGLFQMRNIKVKHQDGYTQIDWWLRYVKSRYNNKPCNALKHWDRFGWQ